MKVAIIGGGAAGFFSAFSVKKHHPNSTVVILEKTGKVLSKVKVSGGGRCNVTNAEEDILELSKAYPRGAKLLKNAFYTFSTKDTIKWFNDRGVELVKQEDNCIFPRSQNSQTIIDCFLKEANDLSINISLKSAVKEIIPQENNTYLVKTDQDLIFDKIIITTGGSPKEKSYDWLKNIDLTIKKPLPSLFTFNMPNEDIKSLMGIVNENTIAKIEGEKWQTEGPLLITHWGMSGPAILKLSAFGAEILAEKNYAFNVLINWTNNTDFEQVKAKLQEVVFAHPQKNIGNQKVYPLSTRLWHFLIIKAGFGLDKKWNELGKKGINKLATILTNDVYKVNGKTTFKEEFVTAGGVSLKNINPKTMQSKKRKGLYFAGEVLDIDGITGGFNFQAAWTTGYIAGKLQV